MGMADSQKASVWGEGGTWSGGRFKNWIRNGWIVPHRASLINFREEATTCCLIIASHGEPPRHRATLFFLYPPILVCTPRKSMPSPPLTLAPIPETEVPRDRFHSFHPSGQSIRDSKIYPPVPLHSAWNRYRSIVIGHHSIRKFDISVFCHFIRSPCHLLQPSVQWIDGFGSTRERCQKNENS